MIILYLPLIVALVGLVIYLVVNHAKASEVGRIMFFAGLFVYLFKG